MKIGILVHSSLGGSTKVGVELAKELHRYEDHEVHVFSKYKLFYKLPGTIKTHHLVDETNLSNVLDTDWSTEDKEAMLQLIDSIRLDVIHFHYAVPFSDICAMVKCKSVGTLHGSDVRSYSEIKSLTQHDALTTVSYDHQKLIKEKFGLDVEVIHNFIEQRPNLRYKQLTNKPTRLIHISNFRPHKNTQRAVRIFKEVSKTHDLQLWLIGVGPDLQEIENDLIGQNVIYFGSVQRPIEILKQADIFLHTADVESFGLAALEAMSVGVPVVCHNVGGVPEVVRDGFLYDTEEEAIYDLKCILDDEVLYKRMSNIALERVKDFSVHIAVEKYLVTYMSVTGCHG